MQPHAAKGQEILFNMSCIMLKRGGPAQGVKLPQPGEERIQHKLWVEQPEDFATSLATKPYPKTDVAQYFKKLQLCKASFA
eukprot:1158990-Pelagomonas_calceolata.AAC.1